MRRVSFRIGDVLIVPSSIGNYVGVERTDVPEESSGIKSAGNSTHNA